MSEVVMYGIDQLLTRKGRKLGLVLTPTGAHLGDDHQVIRIGMKSLLNDLIGNMRTVIVAGIDMIDADRNRLSQNANRPVQITRWSPHLRTGKLHRAIAHAVQCDRAAREREVAAEIHPSSHEVFPS